MSQIYYCWESYWESWSCIVGFSDRRISDLFTGSFVVYGIFPVAHLLCVKSLAITTDDLKVVCYILF